MCAMNCMRPDGARMGKTDGIPADEMGGVEAERARRSKIARRLRGCPDRGELVEPSELWDALIYSGAVGRRDGVQDAIDRIADLIDPAGMAR